MSSSPQSIWLNGSIIPAEEARISPFDRGFLLGEGAFETLRSYNGIAFAVTRHWNRLCASCEALDIPAPALDEFRSALQGVLDRSGLKDARLRFTITRGTPSGKPTMLATAADLPAWPPSAKVAILPWPRNEHSPLTTAKTTSYAENVVALKWAQQQGADEGIFINTRGDVCEGTGSNIFFVHGGTLYTPSISSGCLPGVTRALVLELAGQSGLSTAETTLPASALGNSEEVFLTSTTRQVQPVLRDHPSDSGPPPGTVCRQLAEMFKKLTEINPDPSP